MQTYLPALLGGAMIGLAALLLMATLGKVMGISGIVSRSISSSDGRGWRGIFLIGTFISPLIWRLMTGAAPTIEISNNIVLLVIAGLLVGCGTVIGSGCTSGHGVCGLARFSARSLLATLIFMLTAVATVTIVRLISAGGT